MYSRRQYSKLEYKVKWIGNEKGTWQPVRDLESAADMIGLFQQIYTSKLPEEMG